MYEDGIDGDSLKEVLETAIKRVDIGAAVLPEPLFINSNDDSDEEEEDSANAVSTDDAEEEKNLINNDDDDDDDNNGDGSSFNIQLPNNGNDRRNRGHKYDKISNKTFREGRAPEDTVSSIPTMYSRTLRNEFNSIVIEHHLKWAPLCISEPGPFPDDYYDYCDSNGSSSPRERLGRYDFHHVDAMVDWAIRHNMKVKGHVLVWHVTSPKLLEDLSPEDVREQLKRHIFTTMGHFRGRIKIWDVVNEALAPDGSLAENVFYRKLGPDYIEDCFRWAHMADPDAVLLYNDNKVEGMDGPNKEKADGLYRLLSKLVQSNVPIHGCGIQAHFNAAGVGRNRVPTPRMVKNQIHRIGNLGLKVNISEMDVRVSQLSPELRQIAQRQIYHDIIAAALTEPMFDGIWLWGFSDKHTWVTSFYFEDEPLIFDDCYERKDCYYGLRDALKTITPGGTVAGGVCLDSDDDNDEDGNPWGYQWMNTTTDIINNNSDNSITTSINNTTTTDDSFSQNQQSEQLQQQNLNDLIGGGGDERPDWDL